MKTILWPSFLLALSPCLVEGRTYRAVIDHEIYRRSDTDKNRYQLKIELDPFFFPGEGMETEAPKSPTPAPHVQEWITLSPTATPSNIPSDFPSLAPTGPTYAPTTKENNLLGNGGCVEGSSLYRVNLYDSWGDGWAGTMLKITGFEDQDPSTVPSNYLQTTQTTESGGMMVTLSTTVQLDPAQPFNVEAATPIEPLGVVFDGGLASGSHAHTDVCLRPRRCYRAEAIGGDFLDEVSWDIQPVELGATNQINEPVLDGGAPASCTFSIPDENGVSFCPTECDVDDAEIVHTDEPKPIAAFVETEADPNEPLETAVLDEDELKARQASINGQKYLTMIRKGQAGRVGK